MSATWGSRRPGLVTVFLPLALTALTGAGLAGAGVAQAQSPERFTLRGERVAVYNLVGTVSLEAGSGSSVVVEVTRRGADGRRLEVETGPIDGRETLRVIFPDDEIYYADMGRRSRTELHVRDDGTWGGDGWRGRGRRVRISGNSDGLDASAELRVLVPRGTRIAAYLGVGEATVSNVDGDILVDVAAASVVTRRTRGSLFLETGSGTVSVNDAEGDVSLDTGSGAVELNGVRGGRLLLDTGSGRITGSDIDVGDLDLDTGSGSVRLSGVRADDIRLDSGSGSVELGLAGDVRNLLIDSGSGSITLRVPESLGAEFSIETGSGGIDIDVPATITERRRSHVRGRIGDGDGRIVVDGGSGGVRLTRN
jgi:lia operon protein LiaG